MAELSQAEEIKVAVGVWVCFVDKVVEPMETAAIFNQIKKDLLPDSLSTAVDSVGIWLVDFERDFLGTEQKLEKMIRSYDRKKIIKGQILEMAEHIKNTDGSSHFNEEAAIVKLKRWLE